MEEDILRNIFYDNQAQIQELERQNQFLLSALAEFAPLKEYRQVIQDLDELCKFQRISHEKRVSYLRGDDK